MEKERHTLSKTAADAEGNLHKGAQQESLSPPVEVSKSAEEDEQAALGDVW